MLNLEPAVKTVRDEREGAQGEVEIVAVAQAWSDAERRAAQTIQSQIGVTTAPTASIQRSVGQGGDNQPADVRAVQQRLVVLGVLQAGVETPAASASGAIADSALQQTIRAIERFQERSVRWWMNYPAGLDQGYQHQVQRLALPSPRPSSANLTPGRIVPGDATHEHLNRVSVYHVRFPGAPAAEEIRLRDYVRSAYTLYPHGFDYSQPSHSPFRVTQAPIDWFTSEGGLTLIEAHALVFVTDRHEGGYLTFNSYDLAVLTFGFIQFTASGSLQTFLAHLKRDEAATFDRLFRTYGVDVDVPSRGTPRLVVLEPGTGREMQDMAAARLVGTNPRLAAVFIRSGRDRAVQHSQVRSAIARYASAPLRQQVEYTAPNGTRSQATFRTLLTSPEALATLFDRTIQEGNPGRVREAVVQVARDRRLTDITHIARPEYQRAIVDTVESSLAQRSAQRARRIRDIKDNLTGFIAQRTGAARSQGLEEVALPPNGTGYSQALAVRAGEVELNDTPTLASHQPRRSPDLILRWNTIPDGVTTVDVVLHLHGHSGRGPNMDLRQKLADSGLDLVGAAGAAGRSRPTLAILPRGNNFNVRDRQGQLHPTGYNFPALHTIAGLRRLIDYALEQFGRQVGLAQVRRGRLILTAHSGGGSSAMRILQSTRDTDLEPDEVHTFDALYDRHDPTTDRKVPNADPLIEWVRRRIASAPTRSALRVLFRFGEGTHESSLAVHRALQSALQGQPAAPREWFRVERTGVDHGHIPRRFGRQLLADAHATLPDTQSVTTPATRAHALAKDESPTGWGEPVPAPPVEALQAEPCTVNGDTVTCGSCVARERRVRAAPPANLTAVPADLLYNRNATVQLDPSTLQAYQQLVAAARAAGINGPELKILSGHRDYNRQAPIWRAKLLDVLRHAGCAAAELTCAGPAIDRTTVALRTLPLPHARNAWLERFRQELQQAGCTLSCDVAAAVQTARPGVAPPGTSAHHTGRAVDIFVGRAPGQHSATITDQAAMRWQRRQRVYQWLVCHAERFHFYPFNQPRNGEPWHWEYNPPVTPATQGTQNSTSDMTYMPDTTSLAWTEALQSALPTPDEVQPTPSSSQPYGSHWRSQQPPGLSESARRASAAGAAYPWVERVARALVDDPIFVTTVRHLAQTESSGTFALPAIRFDSRPSAQRPTNTPYVSAWGVFQFNRDAWRALSGVAAAAFPWECSAYDELVRPLRRYAHLFQEIRSAGGTALDAARGLRLWQRTPAGYRTYLAEGRLQGFAGAWQRVAAEHRTPVDRWLRESGVLPGEARGQGLDDSALNTYAFDQPPMTPTPNEARARFVRIANEEVARWQNGTLRETDARMLSTLQEYWATGVDRRYTLAQLADPVFQNGHPWSAAFISWVMQQSGVGSYFRRSAAHANYIRWAIDNRLQNRPSPFRAYRITEVAPQPGDLVCKSRANSGATYDTVQPGMLTHCDFVTEVRPGELTTIGGNVNNSVARRTVAIDANGRVQSPDYFAVIRLEDSVPARP